MPSMRSAASATFGSSGLGASDTSLASRSAMMRRAAIRPYGLSLAGIRRHGARVSAHTRPRPGARFSRRRAQMPLGSAKAAVLDSELVTALGVRGYSRRRMRSGEQAGR
jgi:hypothetical protein